MHDLLEGALQYEVKLMLKEMVCTEGYFTLDLLNSRIENIGLGYMEVKDHPTPISDTTFNSEGNSLKQAGINNCTCSPSLPLRSSGKHAYCTVDPQLSQIGYSNLQTVSTLVCII